jgi:hypothetical protein
LLIFITTNLWIKTSIDLNYLDKLIKIYLILIKELYPLSNYTINNHFLKHAVFYYKLLGPYVFWNAFLFEHLNGVVKRWVHSPYAICEQIRDRSELDFACNIKEAKIVDTSDNKIFKMVENPKNYFVLCKNNKCYKVVSFCKEGNSTFFNGFEFKNLGNFSFHLKFNNLNLGDNENDCLKFDHIFKTQ